MKKIQDEDITKNNSKIEEDKHCQKIKRKNKMKKN